MKSLTQKIFSDTALVSLLNSVNFSGNFIIAVLVGRILGVESLGVFSFMLAFAMIIGVVADFGLTTLLVRKINEKKEIALGNLSQFNRIKLSLALTSLVIVFAFGFFFSPLVTSPVFMIGVIAVIPRAYQLTYESALRAILHQVFPTTVKSINTLFQLASAYFILISGGGLVRVVIAILLLEVITAFAMKMSLKYFAAKEVNKDSASTDGEVNVLTAKEIILESSPLFLFNFFSLSMPRMNVILLEYIISPAAVGIFSAGQRFSTGVGFFSGALSNSYYPLVTSLGEQAKLKYELTKKFILYAFAFGLALSLVLFIFSGNIIDLTFRVEEAKAVLRIISFSVIPVLMYTVLQAYFFSGYQEMFLLRLYGAVWIIAIILSVAFIYGYGFIGAAIVTIIVEYLLVAAQLVWFIRTGKTLKTTIDQQN